MTNKNYYFNEVSKYSTLSNEENIELAKQIEAGDSEALQELIKGNLKLVISIARKTYNSLMGLYCSTVSLDDIIQYGNLGLMTAAQKYDYRKGSFSTYATSWIKKEINEGISEAGPAFHIPAYRNNQIIKVRSATKILTNDLGREPTSREIAQYLGDKFNEKLVNEVKEIMELTTVISLDTPVDDEKERENVCDTISYSNAEVVEHTNHSHKMDIIFDTMDSLLDDKSKLIVKCIYGYENGKQMTYEQVSQYIFNKGYTNNGELITGPGIKYIYDRSIQKLRNYFAMNNIN